MAKFLQKVEFLAQSDLPMCVISRGMSTSHACFVQPRLSLHLPHRWQFQSGKLLVSGQVASHTRSLPLPLGTIVIPLGCLTSGQKRPVSSNLNDRWAADIAWWAMSLMAACQWWRPSLHLQLRAWVEWWCYQLAPHSGDKCVDYISVDYID